MTRLYTHEKVRAETAIRLLLNRQYNASCRRHHDTRPCLSYRPRVKLWHVVFSISSRSLFSPYVKRKRFIRARMLFSGRPKSSLRCTAVVHSTSCGARSLALVMTLMLLLSRCRETRSVSMSFLCAILGLSGRGSVITAQGVDEMAQPGKSYVCLFLVVSCDIEVRSKRLGPVTHVT